MSGLGIQRVDEREREGDGRLAREALTDRQLATTLSRGLEILRCFTRTEPLLGNKEISSRTALPKATISRLTYTLTKLGYLRQEPQTRKYQLGSAALAIAYPLLASLQIRQLARKQMQVLADYTGGTVAMVMCDRLDMACIEVCRHFNAAPELPDIGTFFPLCCNSAGWAALATQTPARQETIINRIRVTQPDLHASHQVHMASGLESISALGYAISLDNEHAIYSVSAPFHGAEQGEMISFCCSLMKNSVREGWLEQDIGPRLVQMVHRLESTVSRPRQ